jgi:hypothetical protein
MRGFITERDFASAECEFPGISRLYEALIKKPATFLELVWQWERQVRREERTSLLTATPSLR